jgi:5-methylcytosine-specific restriction endonuclease McrA
MDWSWREELKLAGWEVLSQLTGWRYAYKKARGLTDLKIHIETERAKQLQPYKGFKTFNAFIFWRAKGYCYLCGHYRCYQDSKPMVTEHKLPLFRWGYTTEENCDLSCWHCNQAKGILTPAEYLNKK